MAKSSIEWTDATWNPIRGCEKISAGCKHCYAEAFARRFAGVPDHPYELGFLPRLIPGKVIEPFSWTSPATVFVNSMSDLFQEAVPMDYVQLITQVMRACPWHVFQVLTKRHNRLHSSLAGPLNSAAQDRHIWWGVSAENRKYGIPRIKALRDSAAKVKFVSVEPLLEDLGKVSFRGIDWVIVGGESGHGARPMEESWVLSIRDQCKRDGAKFFFKQWGGVHKKRTGRKLEGRTWNSMPRRYYAPLPSRNERRALAAQFDEQAKSWNAYPSPLVSINRKKAANA